MTSKISCSPASRGVVVVRRVLLLLAAVTVASDVVFGFDALLVLMPERSGSTLDSRVAPQDFELQEKTLNIVGRDPFGLHTTRNDGDDANGVGLVLQAPDSSGSEGGWKVAGEAELGGEPVARSPIADSKKKPSPFAKWVNPKSSESEVDNPPTDRVARLPMTARGLDLAKPLPKPATKIGAVPKEADLEPEAAPGVPEGALGGTAKELGDNLGRQEVGKKQPSVNGSIPPSMEEPRARPEEVRRQAPDLPPLTRSQQNLRRKVRAVLTHYYNRPLNTRDRSPWEVMHALLAYEAHSKVLQGGPKGEPITAAGWLCYNRACKKRTLMYVDDDGELRVRVGPALQGHRGQLLAMLAQSRINENYPMLVEEHELSIRDLIEMEKRTCYPRTELTFKLIGLMHYLESNETWLNDQGMEWSIPKLVEEELRQPIRGAACGGTHRLSGLTLAYKTRIARGESIDGQYLRAKNFVRRYQQYAYRLQNRDGSFSTEWFRGPGNEESLDRKLKTTGHILEWLLYAATEKELRHWKTTKAANYLANIMYRNRNKDWEAGPLGHAIHALLVYDRLVFSPYDPPNQPTLAFRRSATTSNSKKR